nr:peroxidase 39-like [Ipomoea batatas]
MEFISPRHHHYLILVCSFLLVFCGVVSEAGPLKKNFYKKDCPRVEEIVQNITWLRTSDNLELAAKFLRMHFHDCFGCDGSILLDSTPTNKTEKEAIPNRWTRLVWTLQPFSKRAIQLHGKWKIKTHLSPHMDCLRTKCKNLNDTSAVEREIPESPKISIPTLCHPQAENGAAPVDAAPQNRFFMQEIVDKWLIKNFFSIPFAKPWKKKRDPKSSRGILGKLQELQSSLFLN